MIAILMTDNSGIQLAATFPLPEIGSDNTTAGAELLAELVATVIDQCVVFCLNGDRQPLPHIENSNLQ